MRLLLTLLLYIPATFTFSQSDYEWKNYENSLMIDKNNASSVDSFENTPESIVAYFYASRIRNDSEWEKVIPDEKNRTEKLKQKLNTYQGWTITRFRLISKTEYSKNRLWVKIFFEIEYNGRKDSGTDDVSVDFINGQWIITCIPT